MSSSFNLFLLFTTLGLDASYASQTDHINGGSQSEDVFPVEVFTTEELMTGQRTLEFATILRTTGLLAVKPNQHERRGYGVKGLELKDAYDVALSGFCDCATGPAFLDVEGAETLTMKDGQTTRMTLATATMGRTPLPLSDDLEETCGSEMVEAMESLRDHVDAASVAFTTALDVVLSSTRREGSYLLRSTSGGVYHSVSSIVQSSTNLEHFHVYTKQHHANEQNLSSMEASQPTLDWHTDAGLFLAFVPGRSCDDGSPDESFYVRIPETDQTTRARKAVIPKGAVAIMLGVGAEKWIRSSGLRATRHAVHITPTVEKQSLSHRAWYGMMHLVPENAIVQIAPQRTYGDIRQAMVEQSAQRQARGSRSGDDNEDGMTNAEVLGDMSMGCGSVCDEDIDAFGKSTALKGLSSRRRLQMVDDGSVCNNSTNFYCWMSCLDIPDSGSAQEYVNDGYSLYCLDPSVLASSDKDVSDAVKACQAQGVAGGAMNVACTGSWQPTEDGVPSQKVSGAEEAALFEEPYCYGGTSMYMDGFNWVGITCAIYLFPSLILDTSAKFIVACFGTIVFGIVLEWVICQRRSTMQSLSPGLNRLAASATFYLLQLTLGYSLMLVVMIYSIPLFMCVVLGIVVGHVLFNAQDAVFQSKSLKESNKTKRGPLFEDPTATSTVRGGVNQDNKPNCCSGNANADHGQKQKHIDDEVTSDEDIAIPEGSTPCCQNVL